MEIYAVGGAVRDELLGLPVKDRDWVVVGATPQDMLAQGFLPVGRDFPVFLHPQTHEEYALARTERKTAPGYTGFAFHAEPGVTLEQDLTRRDLTINAMAKDEAGAIIDPHGGRADLAARVLRHVAPAFAEDPVRILRVARFAARFTGFSVAAETILAPYAGRVVRLKARQAESVAPNQPVMEIVATARLKAAVHVPSALAVRLKQGSPLSIDIRESGRRYAAKVAKLNARVDGVSQSLELQVVFVGDTTGLLPGMIGQAVFVEDPGKSN
jgi:hypothetical protein